MKPSGSRGAAKEGERRSAWSRAVGEGPGVFLEKSRGYRDVTWREVGGTLGHMGKSNMTEAIDVSSIVNVTNRDRV